jgi:hypothetical protein
MKLKLKQVQDSIPAEMEDVMNKHTFTEETGHRKCENDTCCIHQAVGKNIISIPA